MYVSITGYTYAILEVADRVAQHAPDTLEFGGLTLHKLGTPVSILLRLVEHYRTTSSNTDALRRIGELTGAHRESVTRWLRGVNDTVANPPRRWRDLLMEYVEIGLMKLEGTNGNSI